MCQFATRPKVTQKKHIEKRSSILPHICIFSFQKLQNKLAYCCDTHKYILLHFSKVQKFNSLPQSVFSNLDIPKCMHGIRMIPYMDLAGYQLIRAEVPLLTTGNKCAIRNFSQKGKLSEPFQRMHM